MSRRHFNSTTLIDLAESGSEQELRSALTSDMLRYDGEVLQLLCIAARSENLAAWKVIVAEMGARIDRVVWRHASLEFIGALVEAGVVSFDRHGAQIMECAINASRRQDVVMFLCERGVPIPLEKIETESGMRTALQLLPPDAIRLHRHNRRNLLDVYVTRIPPPPPARSFTRLFGC